MRAAEGQLGIDVSGAPNAPVNQAANMFGVRQGCSSSRWQSRDTLLGHCRILSSDTLVGTLSLLVQF